MHLRSYRFMSGALIVGAMLASLALPVFATHASAMQVCRQSSAAPNSISPVSPQDWRCNPATNEVSYATSSLYIPPRGDYPEVTGFVYQSVPGGGNTPYATIVHFSENRMYGVLQIWLPTGNGVLTEPRCWRLAGGAFTNERLYVEVAPDACLERLPEAFTEP